MKKKITLFELLGLIFILLSFFLQVFLADSSQELTNNGIRYKIEQKIDFVSFSDILSYFPENLEKVYLQKIKPYLNKGAITVHRYYFRVNKDLDISGFNKTTDQHSLFIDKEKTQIYIIDTYEKENE
jgi:hypothetical protein